MIEGNLLEQMCKADFTLFCKHILGLYVGDMHKELIESFLDSDKHFCVMAARGHSKTTMFSQAFPLWISWKTPGKSKNNEFILIMSSSLDQSMEIIEGIKTYIEASPILTRDLLPENVHKTQWSATKIKFKNGHRIMAAPFGPGVRGKHPTYAICDDVLRDEIANVSYALDTFYSAVFPVVNARNGRHLVVGTPMAFDDLLMDLSTKDTFEFRKYPARKEDGTPQFPELYNEDKLQEIEKTMPAHRWMREYMCEVVGDSMALFPSEIVNNCISLPYKKLNKQEESQSRRFMGWDVALSSGSKADFAAGISITKAPNRPLLVEVVYHKKGTTTEQQMAFIKQQDSYHEYDRILVEEVGLSYGMVQTLTNSTAPEYVRSVEGFKTTHNSKDKMLGTLELLLRNGGIKLPDDKELKRELFSFGIKKRKLSDGTTKQTFEGLGYHDDLVMALAMAVEAVERSSVVPISLQFV